MAAHGQELLGILQSLSLYCFAGELHHCNYFKFYQFSLFRSLRDFQELQALIFVLPVGLRRIRTDVHGRIKILTTHLDGAFHFDLSTLNCAVLETRVAHRACYLL